VAAEVDTNYAFLHYENSIIYGNLPASQHVINGVLGVTGSNTLLENNLPAQSPLICTPTVACTIEAGCTVFDCDPLFQTGTFIPNPSTSPAIDQGNDGYIVNPTIDVLDLDGDEDTTEDIPIDYAGNTRIVGTGSCGSLGNNCVDMGAYEKQ